ETLFDTGRLPNQIIPSPNGFDISAVSHESYTCDEHCMTSSSDSDSDSDHMFLLPSPLFSEMTFTLTKISLTCLPAFKQTDLSLFFQIAHGVATDNLPLKVYFGNDLLTETARDFCVVSRQLQLVVTMPRKSIGETQNLRLRFFTNLIFNTSFSLKYVSK